MGMVFGYRRTLRFLSGIVVGYLLVMLMCAFLSSTLLKVIPTIEPALRLFGACYILWLAFGTARTTYNFSSNDIAPMLFKHGLLLQALNPKAIVFGLTIYTTFLSSITGKLFILGVSTILLTAVTFCSISLWAYGGTKIRRFLHLPHIRKWFNFTLVALLVYCAATLSGILPVTP